MDEKNKRSESGNKKPSALRVQPGVEAGRCNNPRKENIRANPDLDSETVVRGVLDGDRTTLGRAITLIESNSPVHQKQARDILGALMPRAKASLRVGMSGMPGAGKSTFIETVGSKLAGDGRKVAVLAVDPSSSVSKGSILGDKTRMERLSRSPNAFIRPSPTGGILGGVARKTRETIILFEAAGYDVIFVETVGVGQNEITVRSMVDFFLLVIIPSAGEELQGMKKGITEIADAVVVNKADGSLAHDAEKTRDEYSKAMHFVRSPTEGWETRVFTSSARTGKGLDRIWGAIERFMEITSNNGAFTRRRREQARDWLHQMVDERLKESFYSDPAVAALLPEMEKQVLEGTVPASRAALSVLECFEKARKKGK